MAVPAERGSALPYSLQEGQQEQQSCPTGRGRRRWRGRGAQAWCSGAGAGQSHVALEAVKQLVLQLTWAEPCTVGLWHKQSDAGCFCGAVLLACTGPYLHFNATVCLIAEQALSNL